MIYDCFTFFDELELLELRLHELGDVVDKFVWVEATKTHSNKYKPLHYQENRVLFQAFHDQIIHVVVDDMPDSNDSWVLENFQRKCIARGLVNCRPEDFILVSDLDEIPRATTVAKVSREWQSSDGFFSNLARNTLNARGFKRIFHRRGFRRRLRKNHPFILKFEQVIYRHFVNCECVKPRLKYGTRMLRFQDFSCAEEIRHSGYKTVQGGGWHFTFMGGPERISQKLAAYAHQERNRLQFTDVKVISDQIAGGAPVGGMDYQLKIVPLDETFPRYLLEHPGKFSSWIKE
jgi:beta-1,4-mannosyl-glycoprotein beta-1,4-N-acetylglucosaminyltransferase